MSTGRDSGLAPGVRPREVWSWALYDFANSGYTTVVITALFSAYFVSEVAANAAWATLAWTSALALSYLLIMVTAPPLGAWADRHAAKKRLLLLSTGGCVLFTAGLALVGPGDVVLAVLLIVLSNYFFGTGENLIAAFLPELARGEAMGRVSGWGWGLGYLGGLLALGLCLAYVSHARSRGADAAVFVPVSLLITAALFVLASAPAFLFLRERAQPRATPAVAESWARLAADALRVLREFPDLRRFLLCLGCYQAGIQTVVALAAIYAQQAMGFSVLETLQLILVVNLTAALGALGFGYAQDRLGHVRAIALILAGWILTVLLAWHAERPALFWLAANGVGLCLGSSQSAGRALVGWFSPPGREAEFFGLWGLAVKCASVLGPLTYGAVTWISGGDHRLAMLVTGLFFVAGLILLRGVDAGRGRRAAQGTGVPPASGL